MEGLLEFGGGVIGGLIGASGSKRAARINRQIAREQMQFQERMSNTAYQRAVTDMQAAGLNPMLAYSQGGASAPMGSMPQVENVGAAGMQGAQAGQAVIAAMQQVLQSKAQTELLGAEARKVESETLANELHSAKMQAELRRIGAETDIQEQEWNKRLFQNPHLIAASKSEAEKKQIDADLSRDSFSADVARRKAESMLMQLEIPKARAEGKFYEDMKSAPVYLKMLIDLIRGVGSARSLSPR